MKGVPWEADQSIQAAAGAGRNLAQSRYDEAMTVARQGGGTPGVMRPRWRRDAGGPGCRRRWGSHAALIATVAGACAACATKPPPPPPFCPQGEDLAALVSPLVGTLGSGNTVPGAAVPHGMVKLSPDTNAGVGDVDAYEYANDRIEGFSHTHMEGPGGSDNGYSHILLLPQTGPLRVDPDEYPSTFAHDTEEASPGYYAVTLSDYQVRAELTATAHVGFHRYTFPPSDAANVIIDLGHTRGESRGGEVTIVDDHTIEGFGQYNVHPILDRLLSKPDNVTGQSTVFFRAVFSRPFQAYGTWKKGNPAITVSAGSQSTSGPWIGAYATFAVAAGDVVEVQVALSLVSVAQARRNLDADARGKGFDQVRDEARAAWNCYLNRVTVEGGTDEERTTFYTALYHTALHPTDYTEADGAFFSGADGKGAVFTWKRQRFYSDDWCAWDTFRTSRPLATIVEPEVVSDLVASYLHLFTQGGWLQKCTWHATGDSRIMIANPAASIIADAFVKGHRDYDTDTAWAALYKSATDEDLTTLYPGLCGYVNRGTPPEYVENGYISHECDATQGASMTLEQAYEDWCIAQVAQGLGKEDQYQSFMQRAGNYRNQWNPDTGFMQGRMLDGSWVTPFDPTASGKDFCEASAWIYTWSVPHDVPGLIALVGGTDAFVAKLDQFFGEGLADMSNEPSFHTPYLYNYANAPAQTQALVRSLLAANFAPTPGGLPGNDDAGATSAWYVLNAIGIYPVAPGDGTYQLGSPLFTRVVFALNPGYHAGGTFVIEAVGNGPDNVYVQSATLNGASLDRPWITHAELVAGGMLSLEMGPTPSTWGASQ